MTANCMYIKYLAYEIHLENDYLTSNSVVNGTYITGIMLVNEVMKNRES